MPQQSRHSRQKSDDFKIGFVDSNIDLDEALSGRPSLSFRQPKLSCFRIGRARTILGGKLRKITRRIPLNLTVLSVVVLCLSLLIPIALGVVTFTLYPTVVDISLESFQIPTHIASQNQDAFSVGKKVSKSVGYHRKKIGLRRRSADPDPWPLPPTKPMNPKTYTQRKSHWTIDLIYLAEGEDKNMFTVERLKAVHKVEQSIMNFARFQDFCWKYNKVRLDPILSKKYNGCTPPISLVDFFFPSRMGGITFFDGQGTSLTGDAMNKTLNFLLSKQFTYWFVDDKFSSDNRRSYLLRAQVRFGYPLKGFTIFDSHGPKNEEQSKLFQSFMVEMIGFLKTLSTDKVKVLYGGPSVYDYLVQKAMWDDVNMAKYTLILIIIFVFFLTSFSLFLTLFGMLSILVSLPCAYFIFRVVFGIPNVTILSGASLFIIIGIGVDDVFVFINTFIHAKYAKDINTRLIHTISTAGGSTFFTSFTTAAAFGANCLSKMPAVHDFGLFMMLIVISCWLTVILIIPPTLYLWDRFICRLERRLCNCLLGWIPIKCCCTSHKELPGDIQRFLSGNHTIETNSESSLDDDNDIHLEPATGIPAPAADDNSDGNTPSSDDSDLLCLSDDAQDSDSVPLLNDHDAARTSRPNTAGSSQHVWMCSSRLQSCLFYYAKPVYACRYVLLVLYLGILGGSSYLDTRITPSEKPPAFFKKDSNLQQLLDLKYNMSGDNYDCKICDDIVEVTNNLINLAPTKKPVPPTTQAHTKPARLTTGKPGTTKKTPAYVLPTHKHRKETTRRNPQPKTIRKTTAKTRLTVNVTAKPTARTSTQQHTTLPTTPGNGIPQKTDGESNNIDDGPTDVEPSTTPESNASDICAYTSCVPVEKPILDSKVTVNVVFGIKGIDRGQVVRQHVIQNKGSVVMDPKFTALLLDHHSVFIKHMCRICNAFARNKELVRETGADCFPPWLFWKIQQRYQNYKECQGIESHTDVNGNSHARMYYTRSGSPIYRNSTLAYWLVMSFESTVNKGMSSRDKLKWYFKWDDFLKSQVKDVDGLTSAFHTSKEWVHMYMEVIAVNGAIYGIVFSLVLCMVAVIIFTGHILLSIIVILTILGVLCVVVAIFYLLGWHLGAVEAISLSILVGTSVDYCVHLVDGYIISGRFVPDTRLSNKDLRGWRTAAAISHIGSSILSSAMTTIAASIPLCLTTIQLFSKFGQILALNTGISIVYTLTFCMALLTIMAPPRFRRTFKSRLWALVVIAGLSGMSALCMYIVSLKGTNIPGPDGSPLFKV